MGCIAQINQGGVGINVRHLACQQRTGKWDLSVETPIESVTKLHRGQKLVHLAWSNAGSDLAVLDVKGGISVVTLSMALNEFHVSRVPVQDPADDLRSIIGQYWLANNRPPSVPVVRITVCIPRTAFADRAHSFQCSGTRSSMKANGPIRLTVVR